MKLAAIDVPSMPDTALLELVLGLPAPGRPALVVDDLPALARLAPVALAERAEIALQAATRLSAAFELGRRLHAARARRPKRLRRPRDVARFFYATLAPLVHEELWIAALDGHNGVRGARMVCRGGLLGAYVRPADVLRAALELGAVAFVMVHNHPSGDPTPSEDEVELTRYACDRAPLGLAGGAGGRRGEHPVRAGAGRGGRIRLRRPVRPG